MKDIIIGIDAGTSVIKSIAFSLDGEQLAVASVANDYSTLDDGAVEQNLDTTWSNTLQTLVSLHTQIDGLATRVAAIAVTGQGDGTWLIDREGRPVGPALLWLDARSGQIARQLSAAESDGERFSITGTGVNACQQGPQLLWFKRHQRDVLDRSETAFHCKDWLYFNLTGERFTDPSEGCFTFGDFRTRTYSDEVIASLELGDQRRLLPPMIDGVSESLPLSHKAASAIGLPEGIPVILGYVDIICTALGAGLYDPVHETGCTIVGSTGVHMGLARTIEDVTLNSARTGYTMPMPIPGVSAQIQTNMASTLNIDWLLDMAVDLVRPYCKDIKRSDLISRIDGWIRETEPGSLIFHPYISDAGERGPFIDVSARASFIGLSTRHGFAEMVRAVVEGLAFAARDCYSVMGRIPEEIRLTGGAARSGALREIFGSVLGTVLRTTDRQEAGAAGAAMMAAVNIGHFQSMDQCVETWVRPLLGPAESINNEMHEFYLHSFDNYIAAREALVPVWHAQAGESLQ